MNYQYSQVPNLSPPSQVPQTTNRLDLNSFDPDVFNITQPATIIEVQNDLQRVAVNYVHLDCRKDNRGNGPSNDIYFEKSSGKFAITKNGLTKLAAIANISVAETTTEIPPGCQRCIKKSSASGQAQPCGNCPHFYDARYVVTIRFPDPIFGIRTIKASRNFDAITDTKGMTEAQKNRVIVNREAMTESKAICRAIRAALNIPATFEMSDLQKPFVFARIIPNVNHPEIRKAMAANTMQSMGKLFAPSTKSKALPTAPDPEKVYEDDTSFGDDPTAYDDDYSDLPDDESQGYGGYNPPLQPTAQLHTPHQDVCSECRQVIRPYKTRSGTVWSPGDMVAFSMKQFNRPVCYECQQKLKGGRR